MQIDAQADGRIVGAAPFAFCILLFSLVAVPVWAQEKPIVVASKKFSESRLLAEIIAQLIEHNLPVKVERRHNLGGTMICFTALREGEVDVYVEYTGTGLLSILHEPADGEAASDPAATLRRVRERFAADYGLVWLEPLGFENKYAIAVRPDLGITKISELAKLADTARAGFNHEFLERPDGYPGLARHYGFELAHVKGLEHGLAYAAIAAGEIDLMDAYSTEGQLVKYELRLLDDDKQFFPPYQAAPLVRQAALDAHPQLAETINRLAGKLDQPTMLKLNYAVEIEGRSPAAVAFEFLREAELIPESAAPPDGARMSLGLLAQLTSRHLQLTLTATGLATIVGVLLGILVVQSQKLAGPVLAATGVVQTIPSLALLCFMIPLLGIGQKPAIAALALYALLPIVRNTATGILGVPAELKEAGKALGFTSRQLLTRLELPLAAKTIMAGIRTALVINIGTATIAAFIGAGGLGEPIVTGLSLNDTRLILWGAIPAALLAIACDLVMAGIERRLEPKGLRIAR